MYKTVETHQAEGFLSSNDYGGFPSCQPHHYHNHDQSSFYRLVFIRFMIILKILITIQNHLQCLKEAKGPKPSTSWHQAECWVWQKLLIVPSAKYFFTLSLLIILIYFLLAMVAHCLLAIHFATIIMIESSKKIVALISTQYSAHCPPLWWSSPLPPEEHQKIAPVILRIVLLASLVHHFSPVLAMPEKIKFHQLVSSLPFQIVFREGKNKAILK